MAVIYLTIKYLFLYYIHTFVLKYSSLSILKILLKIYSYSRSEIRYSSLSILILMIFSGTQIFEYTHTQGKSRLEYKGVKICIDENSVLWFHVKASFFSKVLHLGVSPHSAPVLRDMLLCHKVPCWPLLNSHTRER